MKEQDSLRRAPVPTNWTKPQCTKLLIENPIASLSCVKWMTETEAQYFQVVSSMLASKKAQQSSETSSSTQGTAWRTIKPWLRLYEAAADDNAKEAFLHKDDTLDRQALDARNNENRAKTYHEIVAENFNDPSKIYNSHALPQLHLVFAESIGFRFNDMPGPINPDQVKDHIAQTRASLMVVVPKWESSGTGFGIRAASAGFGRMTEEIRHERGDCCATFLNGYKEHILYYWHLIDRQDIIAKFLNILSAEVAASSDKPAALNSPHGCWKAEEER